MSNKVINARVKQKRDTDSNWQSKNPTLLNGEIILVDMSDGELRAKIGDGTSTYSNLSFTDEPLRNLINDVDGKISAVSGLVGDTPVSNQISEAIANIESNGGNADTLDGKHAEDFASISDVNALKALVGDTPVSEQVADAIDILHISLDFRDMVCSHSASEIIEAGQAGKVIIVDGSFDYTYTGYNESDEDGLVAFFYLQWTDDSSGEIYSREITIKDDKSFEEYYISSKHASTIVTVDENNIASHNSIDIDDIIWFGGIVKLSYQDLIYDYGYFNYDEESDMLHVYFICYLSDVDRKATLVTSIDNDGHVEEVAFAEEPIIPLPEELDVGKVLVANNYGQVSWGNSEFATASDIADLQDKVGDMRVSDQINNALANFESGKTLTEHLAEEDMILSSRQFGDELPTAGIPGRIFFKRVSE